MLGHHQCEGQRWMSTTSGAPPGRVLAQEGRTSTGTTRHARNWSASARPSTVPSATYSPDSSGPMRRHAGNMWVFTRDEIEALREATND
jgi:hypothetical protein